MRPPASTVEVREADTDWIETGIAEQKCLRTLRDRTEQVIQCRNGAAVQERRCRPNTVQRARLVTAAGPESSSAGPLPSRYGRPRSRACRETIRRYPFRPPRQRRRKRLRRTIDDADHLEAVSPFHADFVDVDAEAGAVSPVRASAMPAVLTCRLARTSPSAGSVPISSCSMILTSR